IMAERGGLSVLQIRLVGQQRARVLAYLERQLRDQIGASRYQAAQVGTQPQPESNPDHLPPWPPGMEPAGLVADPADEVPLARVVKLAAGRVVKELARRDVHSFQQQNQ